MEKILTQFFDLPKMINSKLPMNNFNSMVEGSEHNVAKWAGNFYTVSALVILVTSLFYVLSPIWNGGMGEGSGALGNVVSMLICVYAAFPIAQVVRSAGDSLASSKSGIVDFVFRDLAVANIKLLGHVGALVALFGAICMTITWATSLDVSGSFMTDWTSNIDYAYALPMAAVASLTELLNLGFIGGVLADWSAWDPTSASGEAWSVNGFYAVLWQYVGVVAILAKLYVALAIYYFFYGIISSLVKWIKSPYLPFKTS
ncbi:MAG: hypothetical protein ACJAYD_000182 [Patiriisocius sp.]|jgi:hypothetical protein